jgi:hypothetical protein
LLPSTIATGSLLGIDLAKNYFNRLSLVTVPRLEPKFERRHRITLTEESWVRERKLSEACVFVPKGSFHILLLIAIVLATTRRNLVVASRTQRMTGVVTSQGRNGALLRAIESMGRVASDFRSTAIKVGLVWEGESGLRGWKTVRCVHGAYCLARGSLVDSAESAAVGMIRDVASHTSCVSKSAAP